MKNEGDEAYKPAQYGPKIIIERKLNKDGTSQYVLRDYKRKLTFLTTYLGPMDPQLTIIGFVCR